MILFAYAGNMNVEKFAEKVPSAKKIGIGKLPGYTFVFNTTSEVDESSKANIMRSFDPEAVVWGVLIEIDEKERYNFFNPDPVTNDLKLEPVSCIAQDGSVYHAEAFTTKSHATNTHLLPYDWYHARIIKLATKAGLPETYINQLSKMNCKVDPDEARRIKKYSS